MNTVEVRRTTKGAVINVFNSQYVKIDSLMFISEPQVKEVCRDYHAVLTINELV